jgi:hypothetical protein
MTRGLLAIAVVVQVAVFVLVPRDSPTDDPLAYAENAHAIATDAPGYFTQARTHPFAMRLGLTVPLAAIYRTVGAGPLSTHVLSLFASIAILAAVHAAAPTVRAKCCGIGFAACSLVVATRGAMLDVDLLCGAVIAWMLVMLGRRDRSVWWTVGAVVAWFYAFLVKETALWFAPVWLYVVAVDLRARGWRASARAYAGPVAVGVALAAAYLAVCAAVWHDPLARFTGIDQLAGQHRWTAAGYSTADWVERLTWGPPWLLVITFGAPVVVAAAGVRRIATQHHLWLVATAGFLLMFWFGSASSRAYEPLPLAARMLVPALPGVLVLAALASDTLPWRRGWVAIAVLAVVLPYGRAIIRSAGRQRHDAAFYDDLRAQVAGAPARRFVIVCGNARCVSVSTFHFGFTPPPNVEIVHVEGAGTHARIETW